MKSRWIVSSDESTGSTLVATKSSAAGDPTSPSSYKFLPSASSEETSAPVSGLNGSSQQPGHQQIAKRSSLSVATTSLNSSFSEEKKDKTTTNQHHHNEESRSDSKYYFMSDPSLSEDNTISSFAPNSPHNRSLHSHNSPESTSVNSREGGSNHTITSSLNTLAQGSDGNVAGAEKRKRVQCDSFRGRLCLKNTDLLLPELSSNIKNDDFNQGNEDRMEKAGGENMRVLKSDDIEIESMKKTDGNEVKCKRLSNEEFYRVAALEIPSLSDDNHGEDIATGNDHNIDDGFISFAEPASAQKFNIPTSSQTPASDTASKTIRTMNTEFSSQFISSKPRSNDYGSCGITTKMGNNNLLSSPKSECSVVSVNTNDSDISFDSSSVSGKHKIMESKDGQDHSKRDHLPEPTLNDNEKPMISQKRTDIIGKDNKEEFINKNVKMIAECDVEKDRNDNFFPMPSSKNNEIDALAKLQKNDSKSTASISTLQVDDILHSDSSKSDMILGTNGGNDNELKQSKSGSSSRLSSSGGQSPQLQLEQLDKNSNSTTSKDDYVAPDVFTPKKKVNGKGFSTSPDKTLRMTDSSSIRDSSTNKTNSDETLQKKISPKTTTNTQQNTSNKTNQDGENSGADDEKTLERPRRKRVYSDERRAPRHRRTRSGDGAAATLLTGGTDWIGMELDQLPRPYQNCDEDDATDLEHGDNDFSQTNMQGQMQGNGSGSNSSSRHRRGSSQGSTYSRQRGSGAGIGSKDRSDSSSGGNGGQSSRRGNHQQQQITKTNSSRRSRHSSSQQRQQNHQQLQQQHYHDHHQQQQEQQQEEMLRHHQQKQQKQQLSLKKSEPTKGNATKKHRVQARENNDRVPLVVGGDQHGHLPGILGSEILNRNSKFSESDGELDLVESSEGYGKDWHHDRRKMVRKGSMGDVSESTLESQSSFFSWISHQWSYMSGKAGRRSKDRAMSMNSSENSRDDLRSSLDDDSVVVSEKTEGINNDDRNPLISGSYRKQNVKRSNSSPLTRNEMRRSPPLHDSVRSQPITPNDDVSAKIRRDRKQQEEKRRQYELLEAHVKSLDSIHYEPPVIEVGPEEAKKYPTYICPVCKKRQREFFTASTAPNQFESPAGFLTFYFLVYVIASLYIFGMEEGWPPLDCVYFSVITLTTAGLGDYVPTTDSAKIICSIFIYFGVACIGLVLGSLLASSLDDASRKAAKDNLASSCPNCARLQNIPRSFKKKVNAMKFGERWNSEKMSPGYRHPNSDARDPNQGARMSFSERMSNDQLRNELMQQTPPDHNNFKATASVEIIDDSLRGTSIPEPIFMSPQFSSPGSAAPVEVMGRQSHTRHYSLDLQGKRNVGLPDARLGARSHMFRSDRGHHESHPFEGRPQNMGNFHQQDWNGNETMDGNDDSDSIFFSDDGYSTSSGEEDLLKPVSKVKAAKYVFLTLKQAVANSVLIIAIGGFGFYFIENMTAVDSFYFTTVLLTTVGYGDITPTTPAGKLFATLYVLIAGTILLHNMSLISMIPLELRKRRIERAVLMQFGDQLDDATLLELATGPLVKRLQLSENRSDGLSQCTREMFALAMLVRLGRISEQDVRSTFAAFRKLDLDNDGLLSSHDIIMCKIKEAHSGHGKAQGGGQNSNPRRNLFHPNVRSISSLTGLTVTPNNPVIYSADGQVYDMAPDEVSLLQHSYPGPNAQLMEQTGGTYMSVGQNEIFSHPDENMNHHRREMSTDSHFSNMTENRNRHRRKMSTDSHFSNMTENMNHLRRKLSTDSHFSIMNSDPALPEVGGYFPYYNQAPIPQQSIPQQSIPQQSMPQQPMTHEQMQRQFSDRDYTERDLV